MNNDWIIGVDVAASGIHFQVQSQSGKPLGDGKASKSMEGYASFKQICHDLGVRWERTLIVMEATGRHHLPWCERLIKEGACVFAINPLLTKRLYSTRNAIRDSKDDRLDAHSLSEIGRVHKDDLVNFTYHSQVHKMELQSLVSARRAIRKQCTNLLKSAGDLLGLVFPESKTAKLDLTHSGFRKLLLRATTPGQIAQVDEDELRRVLGKKAPKARRLACESFTPEKVSQACSDALRALVETIEELFRQLSHLEHAITKTLKSPRHEDQCRTTKLIRSVPGFGEKTAPIIAAFLPEGFEQWGSKKKIVAKLQAYYGCDPRKKESGAFKGKVKISKRGIEIVRTALYQASFCSTSHDPTLKAYYDKKKAEGDHHDKAVFDVARKNLRRIVAVLINQKEFDPAYENKL